MLLLICVLTACNLTLVPIATGGQSTPPPVIPTHPSKSPNSASLPTIEVYSTLPTAIREQAQRIQFKTVSSPESVSGELSANESAAYVLWAQAGQTLTVNTSGNLQFTILDENGMLLDTETGTKALVATLPSNGDYYVVAEAPTENGRYSYTLHTLISNRLPLSAAVPFQSIQELEHIIIEVGKTSTTIPGELHGSEAKQYQLPAAAGQTLVVFLNATPPEIQVSIKGQDSTELGHTINGSPLTLQLPITQDYFLTVSSVTGSVDVDYLMTLSLLDSASPPPPPEQNAIIFAPGATSTRVNGTLSEAANKTYTYDGTNGQHLILNTTPADSGLTISIQGKNGSSIAWALAGTPLSTVLPASQVYFINLTAPDNTPNGVDYSLTIQKE